MKKFYFLLVTLLMAGSVTASAQFMGSSSRVSSTAEGYNSVWVGYAPTTIKSTGGLDVSISGINTFSFGVLHTAPLPNTPLLWEVGANLEYAHKKGSFILSDDATLNVFAIKVPLNIVYALPLSDGIMAYPFLGLNARGYLTGTLKEKDWDDDVYYTVNIFSNDEDDMDGDAFKRFSLGYQLGLRVGFSKYFASISYGGDFVKIAEDTTINMVTLGLGMAF